MDENVFLVTARESGERIDALLACNIDGLSRSAAQRLIENGLVTLGEAPLKKNYKCTAGDRFTVVLPEAEETALIPQDIPLEIAYEDEDVIVERIHEAAKYVPLENLYLSPQCGFASCEIGNKLTEDEQWAKIALVKRISERVWK